MPREWESHWPEFERDLRKHLCRPGLPVSNFLAHVKDKMAKGAKEYGDKSFYKAVEEVLQELKEESVDLCGWAMLAYSNTEDRKVKKRMLSVSEYGCAVYKYICDTERYMLNPDPVNHLKLVS